MERYEFIEDLKKTFKKNPETFKVQIPFLFRGDENKTFQNIGKVVISPEEITPPENVVLQADETYIGPITDGKDGVYSEERTKVDNKYIWEDGDYLTTFQTQRIARNGENINMHGEKTTKKAFRIYSKDNTLKFANVNFSFRLSLQRNMVSYARSWSPFGGKKTIKKNRIRKKIRKKSRKNIRKK